MSTPNPQSNYRWGNLWVTLEVCSTKEHAEQVKTQYNKIKPLRIVPYRGKFLLKTTSASILRSQNENQTTA